MASSISGRWLPMESNPEVMTKFLHNSGLPKAWAVSDVLGLDEALLAMLPQPSLALILLFPLKNEELAKMVEETSKNVLVNLPKDLYYMKQNIANACGTVALVHSVANNLDKINLLDGSSLKTFLEETKNLNPDERAAKFENADSICENHDEVAREGQTSAPGLEDRVDYHFIAFVEKDGRLFELDGRKSGPIDCGKIEDSFLSSAAKACREYMAKDPENINFNVLALTAAEQ